MNPMTSHVAAISAGFDGRAASHRQQECRLRDSADISSLSFLFLMCVTFATSTIDCELLAKLISRLDFLALSTGQQNFPVRWIVGRHCGFNEMLLGLAVVADLFANI